MTVVRIAVARFELIVDTPTLARTAVSPANIADKSAQMSHRIAYHREKIGRRRAGAVFGRVHMPYRTYRTDGTYDRTLDIACPGIHPLSPLTSHLSRYSRRRDVSPLHLVPLHATLSTRWPRESTITTRAR